MVALRSQRLESLFGAPLDELQAEHIHSLVTASVQETFDLDFKLTLYDKTEKGRRDLAGDVAAMANTAGGIIVLGVEEDDQARAIAAPGVAVSDGEIGRMRQIIASLVSPMPVLDILTVVDHPGVAGGQNSNGDGEASGDDSRGGVRGFFVLAVPRSPNAPHAVLINYALRYPKRNGATTRYLSEPEVAAAYRDRARGAEGQAARIDQLEREALDRLDVAQYRWVVVTLVPDLPGDLIITSEAFKAFDHEIRRKPWAIMPIDVEIMRTEVGRRRLRADGTSDNSPLARWLYLELHTDGGGVFAACVPDRYQPRTDVDTSAAGPRPQLVDDESTCLHVLEALKFLAGHARDRAQAGGSCVVRARLYAVSTDRPTAIGHSRQRGGFPESRTRNVVTTAPDPAETVATLDDLAESGPALVSVAARLVDELGHAYGVPEMGQITREGQLRRRYWRHGWSTQIVEWAETNHIEVTDEILT
jgi:hypothetical protein